jgi:hypothetical protein
MTRQRIAITAAAVILVAGVVAGRERPTLELIETRTAAAVQTDGGISLEKLERRENAAPPQADPFARPAQPEPRAAAARPARAEKPSAPPLPFRYFGKLTENGKTEVYVMRGDELLTVAAGQSIGEYRVDQVTEASIAFTYLPLKTKQTMELQ